MADALLAYAHILAFLSWAVFLTSQTALLRTDWLNAAVIERLVRVERIASAAALAVLATGLARLAWSPKGGWAWGQPLLWAKLVLFAVMVTAGWRVGQRFRAWQRQLSADGGLPTAADIDRVRRLVMRASHLMVLLPLAGVLLSRGLLAV